MTTVERFDDPTTSWVEITQYQSWKITTGVSDIQIAPEATLQLPRTSEVSAGTRIRIRENTTTTFEGTVERTKPRSQSAMKVDASHDAYGLFEENIDLSVSGTDEDVLQAALNAAGGSWTLAYSGTATSLGETYEVEGRSVKRVFRDMVDRVGRVWWVGVDHTIHVEPLGDRGTFASVDTSQDDAVVTEYTPDDVDTVVNDVTVVGTGGEKVTGGAEDSGSISDYGRQPERTNVSYITTSGEANSYASELLNPQPDSSATVRVGASVGDVASPVVNYSLDVTDTQGVGLDDELVVEKQTVSQGSAELELGEGAGVNIAKFNRREKSKEDVTEPGSVYNSDRIADGAIESEKLVDTAVIEEKIADLSITETKIQDDSISTPKLKAEAVTAAKILAGTITASEIAAGTLTANEIDTLDLDTNQLTIGANADAGIQFNVLATADGDYVEMLPQTGSVSQIGSGSAPFGSMYADRVIAASAVLEDSEFAATFTPDGTTDSAAIANPPAAGTPTTVAFYPDDDGTGQVGLSGSAFSEMWAYEVNAETVLPEGGSDTGNVGVTGDYWQGMRAGAYFEESPIPTSESRNGIDLAELRESDWYNPPGYVSEGTRAKQGSVERGLSTSEVGDGTDAGVELGTMANYLLGVCREQQAVIDEQSDRLDNLEARLSKLEDDPNA